MGLDNHIEYAINEIQATQSLPFFFILCTMIVMNKGQSFFIKQIEDAYGKDSYYRFIQSKRYNWRKLLSLLSLRTYTRKELGFMCESMILC